MSLKHEPASEPLHISVYHKGVVANLGEAFFPARTFARVLRDAGLGGTGVPCS